MPCGNGHLAYFVLTTSGSGSSVLTYAKSATVVPSAPDRRQRADTFANGDLSKRPNSYDCQPLLVIALELPVDRQQASHWVTAIEQDSRARSPGQQHTTLTSSSDNAYSTNT